MAGLLLGTCCHGLVPRPGNMPQQWSSHGPVILFIIFNLLSLTPTSTLLTFTFN
jgi:hypothetical protein